jgi:hypothetical protein
LHDKFDIGEAYLRGEQETLLTALPGDAGSATGKMSGGGYEKVYVSAPAGKGVNINISACVTSHKTRQKRG